MNIDIKIIKNDMNFEGKQNSICKQILQKMLSMLSKLKLLKKKISHTVFNGLEGTGYFCLLYPFNF